MKCKHRYILYLSGIGTTKKPSVWNYPKLMSLKTKHLSNLNLLRILLYPNSKRIQIDIVTRGLESELFFNSLPKGFAKSLTSLQIERLADEKM